MASKYQKRHYEDIAETLRVHYNHIKISMEKAKGQWDSMTEIIARTRINQIQELVNEFTDTFARDNPNFSPIRFKTAIYGEDFPEEAVLR